MVSKVNRTKSPLFFPLESLETRLDKFSKGLDKFSNGLDKFSNGLERLKTRLKPRSSKFSRTEDQESSFEYRASRDCQLTFEWYCMQKSLYLWSQQYVTGKTVISLKIQQNIDLLQRVTLKSVNVTLILG